MKNILVPCNSDVPMWPVFEAAHQVAKHFGAYVEGIAVSPELPLDLTAEFVVFVPTLDPEARRDLVRRSQKAFAQSMIESGLSAYEHGTKGPSYGFAEGQLASDVQIGRYGRLFDLVVMGRPNAKGEPTRTATVEAALFDSGRPVLLVPPSRSATIGQTIVIAWNGSTETARTVALGMPLLRRAQRVIVLTIDGWTVEGPDGSQLATSLRRSGMDAEAITRDMKTSAGEAILEHAKALGADLLFKGAYTQSRLRQMIFGGATRHIIMHANLPVLIAH